MLFNFKIMDSSKILEGILYILIGIGFLLYMIKKEKNKQVVSFTTKIRGYGVSIILITAGILLIFFRKE